MPKLLGHQESVGGDAQAGVVVKPPPASAFIVPKPQFLFEILVVALNAPAHLGFEDHALQRHLLGQRGQPVLHGLTVAFGPLNEQPLLGAQLRALIVPMGSTHPNPRKSTAQGEVGALAPFQGSAKGRAADRTPLP